MALTDDNPAAGSHRWLVFVCILAAVICGSFYLIWPETPFSPDEREYVTLGIHLAETGELRLPTGEVAKRMPLYPAMVAAVYKWQGRDVWLNGVLLIQTVLAWCTILVIALTAERLADGRAGWIAGTIAALYSPFRFLQMSFLTETLLVFLLSLALLLYVATCLHARSSTGRAAGLAGVSILLGLCVLTRANALLFILPFAVDTAWRQGAKMRRVGRVLVILLPALCCACGWAARNNSELGAPTLSTSGGLNLYLGHNARYAAQPGLGGDTDYGAFDRLRTDEGLSELEADRRLYRRGVQFILAHPGETIVNTGRKLLVWLRPSVTMSAPTLPLLVLGLVAFHGRRRPRTKALTGWRRFVYLAALAACVPCAIYWVVTLKATSQPWTSPLYVVPIGLFALILLRCRLDVRGLLVGLFASQLAVAVVFIPLARLRWVVDGILIVAIAVGLSGLCGWLTHRGAESTPAADTVSTS